LAAAGKNGEAIKTLRRARLPDGAVPRRDEQLSQVEASGRLLALRCLAQLARIAGNGALCEQSYAAMLSTATSHAGSLAHAIAADAHVQPALEEALFGTPAIKASDVARRVDALRCALVAPLRLTRATAAQRAAHLTRLARTLLRAASGAGYAPIDSLSLLTRVGASLATARRHVPRDPVDEAVLLLRLALVERAPTADVPAVRAAAALPDELCLALARRAAYGDAARDALAALVHSPGASHTQLQYALALAAAGRAERAVAQLKHWLDRHAAAPASRHSTADAASLHLLMARLLLNDLARPLDATEQARAALRIALRSGRPAPLFKPRRATSSAAPADNLGDSDSDSDSDDNDNDDDDDDDDNIDGVDKGNDVADADDDISVIDQLESTNVVAENDDAIENDADDNSDDNSKHENDIDDIEANRDSSSSAATANEDDNEKKNDADKLDADGDDDDDDNINNNDDNDDEDTEEVDGKHVEDGNDDDNDERKQQRSTMGASGSDGRGSSGTGRRKSSRGEANTAAARRRAEAAAAKAGGARGTGAPAWRRAVARRAAAKASLLLGIASAACARNERGGARRRHLAAEARRALRRAVRLEPASGEAAFALALTLADARQIDAALASARAAVALCSHAAAWNLLALLLSAKRQYAAALAAVDAGLTLTDDVEYVFSSFLSTKSHETLFDNRVRLCVQIVAYESAAVARERR
jgi:hypothetical protein